MPFKSFLVSTACGCSFILGTSIIAIGGVWAFLSGFAMYFLGYWLMDKYKEMK